MTTVRDILRTGSTGADVLFLQQVLGRWGYFVFVDGVFGGQTLQAVCAFQRGAKLVMDGVVGPKTWEALVGILPVESDSEIIDSKMASLFENAAKTLNVEVAAIRAVHQVEAGGRSGFLPDGRAMILFEGHIFRSQLKKLGIAPEMYQSQNEDILFPEWDSVNNLGGIAEYERLNRDCQFEAFVRFIQNAKLDIPLRELRWADFARQYNGPRYKENRYNERLETAFLQYSNKHTFCD